MVSKGSSKRNDKPLITFTLMAIVLNIYQSSLLSNTKKPVFKLFSFKPQRNTECSTLKHSQKSFANYISVNQNNPTSSYLINSSLEMNSLEQLLLMNPCINVLY